MCSFYGWTLGHVKDLSIDDFDQLWKAITVIESRTMLNAITVSDFSSLKQSERQKLHKGLSDDAYPSSLKPVRKVSNAELARILGG